MMGSKAFLLLALLAVVLLISSEVAASDLAKASTTEQTKSMFTSYLNFSFIIQICKNFLNHEKNSKE